MQRLRDDFLADAGLAEDQHRDLARRDEIDECVQPLHHRIDDDALGCLRLDVPIGALRRNHDGFAECACRADEDHRVAELDDVADLERHPVFADNHALYARAVRAAEVAHRDRIGAEFGVATRDRLVRHFDAGIRIATRDQRAGTPEAK